VILVDANLLLYARLSSFPEHGRAHAWLDAQLNARAGVGLPWESLTAFLRLATNPRFLPRPLSMEQAWTQVRDWLALPSTWCPAPADDHASILDGLIRGAA
jgi:predicted nucleic acid-binding protein